MGCRLAGPFFCILVLSILRQVLAEDDSQCLQELQKSVTDPKNYLSSWNFGNSTPGSVCNFAGITCWNAGENKVLAIKLQGAELTGAFPSGLRQCNALQNLDLSQNAFTGSIPSDLCKQVPYMTTLDLSQNTFRGSIPFALGDCQYLQALNLQHNQLSGQLPSGIGALPKLKNLDVSSNSLTGQIPSSYVNRPDSLEPFQASAFSNNPGLCGPPVSKSCSSKSSTGVIVVIIVAAAAIVACLCAICVWCFFVGPRMKEKLPLQRMSISGLRAVSHPCRWLYPCWLVKLKFSDLPAATNDFSKNNIIGEG